MKRFLKKNILLVFTTPVFLILFLKLSYLLLPNFSPKGIVAEDVKSSSSMILRMKDIKKAKDIDLLFLGSSHAYRGFDTRIFNQRLNLTSLNMGSSAQTHIQTKVLLNRYLDSINPKLIIYEVFPNLLCNKGIESAIDIMVSDKIDYNFIDMLYNINDFKLYNNFLHYYLNKYLNFISKHHHLYNEDTYINGGYVERKIKYFDKNKSYNKKKYELIDYQLNSFFENIKIIRNKNISYLLVQAPLTSKYYESHTNNSYVDSIYSSQGKYYNFNNILKLNDSLHFYDNNHLNQNGVKIFNNKLIDILLREHYDN